MPGQAGTELLTIQEGRHHCVKLEFLDRRIFSSSNFDAIQNVIGVTEEWKGRSVLLYARLQTRLCQCKIHASKWYEATGSKASLSWKNKCADGWPTGSRKQQRVRFLLLSLTRLPKASTQPARLRAATLVRHDSRVVTQKVVMCRRLSKTGLFCRRLVMQCDW